MTLFQRIRERGYKSLSIIGLAKNVGKTTTLNYLIGEASREPGMVLGITSTGWDGEAYDTITGNPKPKIIAPARSIIATTTGCLPRFQASCETLKKTGMMTSLGEVVILRTEEEGRVEIAGPVTISELIELREQLFALGCSLILFDGAINRKASASPSVCEAVVLASGANAGYHLQDVKNHTSFWINCFSLPHCGDRLNVPEEGGRLMLLDGDLRFSRCIEDLESELPAGDGYLVMQGALTDEILEALIRLKSSRSLIIEDVTKIFVTSYTLGRWKKGGGQIIVRYPMEIAAVTVNPVAVSGRSYEAGEFLGLMGEICAPYPTWDIVLGKGVNLDNEAGIITKEDR